MTSEKPGINDRQLAFCHEYIKDWNGTQAAIRAGYSKKTANEQAARLLANVNIRQLVRELADEVLDGQKTEIKTQVINNLREIANDDNERDEIYNKKGELVMVSRRDRIKCNELLGKYVGMFNDKVNVELTGKDGAPIPISFTFTTGDGNTSK